MSLTIFLAAAAAQVAASQAHVDPAVARAQGIAQAQAALAAQSGQTSVAPAVQFTPAVAPAIAAPAMTNAVLRVGTEIPLRLSQELTTKGKRLRVGDRFHLE